MLRIAPLLAPLLLAAAPSAQGQAYFPPPEAQGGWRSLVRANVDPSYAERRAVRNVAGMNAKRLRDAKDLVLPHGGSFLVIRRGWIVSEWGPATTHHIASMAKSFTGLAMMRMLDMSDQGAWTTPIGMQDFVHPFFGAAFLNSDPGKAAIRLEHLLTMSSGLEFHDSPTPTLGYFQDVIQQPMAHTPGTVWTYSSLAVDLVSVMIQNISGQTTKDFFRAEIGDPIGMPHSGWQTMGPYTVGSAYAYMAVREVARPLYLLLQGGAWDGQEVLSPARAELLTKPAANLQGTIFGQPNSPFVTNPLAPGIYGHLFWTNAQSLSALGPSVPQDAFYMAGHGTNFAVAIPSQELIVVRLGAGPYRFDELLFSAVVQTVVDAIRPDVSRDVISRPGRPLGIRRN